MWLNNQHGRAVIFTRTRAQAAEAHAQLGVGTDKKNTTMLGISDKKKYKYNSRALSKINREV